MRNHRGWAIGFVFAVGCSSSDNDGAPGSVGGESSSAGAAVSGSANGGSPSASGGSGNTNGGSAPSRGGSGAQAGAGTGGGVVTGGMGGSLAIGGMGGAPSANGGRASTGGRGGAGGSSGKGGSGNSGSAGTAGAGTCVPNVGCKLQAPPSSGDIHQDCVDRINQFRTQCACLPALQRNTAGEACADQMAEYDANANTAHAGFSAKICMTGGSQNECPGYSSNTQVISLCMQQMWDEGPPPMTPCTGDCFQTYGHYINMTSTTITKVACGFFTTAAGKVWAPQNFSR